MSVRTALVTGANRGIGLELCRQLLRLESIQAVIATTRNVTKSAVITCLYPKTCIDLSPIQDLTRLSLSNPKIHILQLETRDHNAYYKFLDDCHQIVRNKGLNLMINNAGVLSRDTLSSVSADSLSFNLEVNTIAPLMLTKKLLPLLKTSANNGDPTAVVNVSSTLGSFATNLKGMWYPYSISKVNYQKSPISISGLIALKAGLNMVTKMLATDLAEHRIRAISLHPGWVKTDMGTDSALLDVQFAVTSMMKVLVNIDDNLNGKLINYDSKVLQF